MDHVGFPGEAHLPLMGLGGKYVGASQQVNIRIGMIALNAFYNVFEPDSRHAEHLGELTMR
jgi:hypothetical protein